MATTISVNKQSVSELLRTGRTKPFIIPEYQRPYAWSSEQIETLFEDIWEFSTTIGGLSQNSSYFLGSIVSFENEDGKQEIIDGQQRITSLFLLLRAIYTKLINGDDANTDAAQNFIRQIEPAIWHTDNRTGKVNFANILLTSKVVNNEGNEILRDILETGIANPNSNDNYSKNYLLFQKLYDEQCTKSPLKIYDFIYALLNQSIMLPISADSQDTALTIFSTLNNRGLPLSDADIFKAKIYNNLQEGEKESFIEEWKALEKEASEAKESIQQLFYYYMFYLRAKENDVSSTTPGVRKFYSANKFIRLYDSNLMQELRISLNIWKVINANQDIPEENWDNNPKIRKALDTLNSYPNEFWKYPVIIYYLSHRNKDTFNNDFLLFLNKLIEELMTRFLLFPTINAVKADILKLDAKIINDPHPDFGFRAIDKSSLGNMIRIPHRNIVRMLLKSYAYNHQEQLLPDNWQIEHILPQKWQTSFFTDATTENVNEKIEHIGNKTPFERKLNIIASNGYFKKKQAEYQKSEIEVTKILVASIAEDWTLEHIKHRDNIVSSEIMKLLQDWNTNYQSNKNSLAEPSADELEMIEAFKQKGWV
jgi:uncharacterized protein with ParB-like and HNH nuclease domain